MDDEIMGSGIRSKGQKSYAILRHTDAIMAHLQICPACSEYVMEHVYPAEVIRPIKGDDRPKQERL